MWSLGGFIENSLVEVVFMPTLEYNPVRTISVSPWNSPFGNISFSLSKNISMDSNGFFNHKRINKLKAWHSIISIDVEFVSSFVVVMAFVLINFRIWSTSCRKYSFLWSNPETSYAYQTRLLYYPLSRIDQYFEEFRSYATLIRKLNIRKLLGRDK